MDKVLLNQYVSAREAGRELNISGVTIGEYARTGRLFKSLYYFSFDLLDASSINEINKLLFIVQLVYKNQLKYLFIIQTMINYMNLIH